MASKVTPYFILTADGVSAPEQTHCDVIATKADDAKEKTDKENKKHITMSRNELTRKRMELIQRKLEESRAKHAEKMKLNSSQVTPRIGDAFLPHSPHTYVPPDVAPKNSVPTTERGLEMVSIAPANNGIGGSPYVYFVVSVDKIEKVQKEMPTLDDSLATASISTKSSQRRKNPSRRRRRGKDDSLVSQSDGNLNLHRSYTMPVNFPKNPPATPATVTTSHEKTDEGTEKRPSVGDLTDFDNKSSLRSFSAKLIELPYISADQQRKNLGSSNASMEGKAMEVYRRTISQDSRRVHFAENFDLPSISANGLSIPRGLFTKNFGSRPTTMPAILSGREEFERPRYICPKTAFGTPRTRKQSQQPLNLPRIDIVSGVYDELIVKAIESYISEFPAGSKQTNLARQLLKQLKDKTLTSNDLAQFEKRSLGRLSIKEIDPDTSKSFEGGIKTSRCGKRPSKPKSDGEFSALAPTCFRMAKPGTQTPREIPTVGK